MINKKTIITGGAGFIGSNLARYLANKQNDVSVIDNLSTGRIENIRDFVNEKKITFIKGSITDLAFLEKAFKNIDYVFHQAALPSVPRSIQDPASTNQVNINGTLNVLLAAKNTGVQKVIYASSSSVYGDNPVLPKQESMIPNPLSPYAISKLSAEYYCQVFTNIYQLPTISLRYFNVYGPRQDPLSEYAAVIPRFITSIMHNKSPTIYGDGTQTRDFTYIDDVIHANIMAAESKAIGVFNIAGGYRITINELAAAIQRICNTNLKIKYEDIRPGDVKHSLADISKAKDALNFSPKYKIENGLMETVAWFKKQQ